MSLQRKKKTVALLNSCYKAYAQVQTGELVSIRCVALDFASVHMWAFSDGSFQNLSDKHSRIGFDFVLADWNDQSNLFHWHGSWETSPPASKEEPELLPLDVALLRIRDQCRIMFHLLQKKVAIVLYIDGQALWQNVMKATAPNMPEVRNRCNEQITDEIIDSVCLIESKFNSADAMTKKRPNHYLVDLIH